MRFLIVILSLFWAYATYGRTLQPGLTNIGLVDDDTRTINCHIRAASKASTNWGLAWNITDSANYHKALISIPSSQSDIYIPPVTLTIYAVTDGIASVIDSQTITNGFDINGGYNSIRLISDEAGARLYAGHNQAAVMCRVPVGPGGVAIVSDKPIDCTRTDFDCTRRDRLGTYPRSLDDLKQSIANSQDATEGVWEYLDRDINMSMASVGGRYTLATVANAEGGYDIIYIRGADINSHLWQPLTIKGHMSATIFVSDYDLQWLDADSQLIIDDTHASLSEDRAVLTLHFPTLRSQLRLRRLPIDAVLSL